MPQIDSGIVDCVLATEMIYIVPDTNMSLKEFHRVLKKNGTLIISFLTEGYPWILADESHRFTRKEVENFLKQNNFTIVDIFEYETNILVVAKRCC